MVKSSARHVEPRRRFAFLFAMGIGLGAGMRVAVEGAPSNKAIAVIALACGFTLSSAFTAQLMFSRSQFWIPTFVIVWLGITTAAAAAVGRGVSIAFLIPALLVASFVPAFIDRASAARSQPTRREERLATARRASGWLVTSSYAILTLYLAKRISTGSLEPTHELIPVLTAALFFLVFKFPLADLGHEITELEHKGLSVERMNPLRFHLHFEFGMIAVGTIMTLGLLFATSSSDLSTQGRGSPNLASPILGVLVVATLLGASLLVRADPTPEEVRLPSWGAFLAIAGCLGWAVTFIVAIVATRHVAWLGALFASILFAGLVAESLIANVAWLQVVRLRPAGYILASTAALGAGTMTFWLLSAGFESGTDPASIGGALTALGVTAASVICIGLLAATRLKLSTAARPLTNNHPLSGVLQDLFLYALLFLFAVWLPFFFYSRVHSSLWSRIWLTVKTSGAYVVPAMIAYRWFLDMNKGHIAFEESLTLSTLTNRCAPRKVDEATNKQRKRALRRHVRFQENWTIVIAAFSLIMSFYNKKRHGEYRTRRYRAERS